MLKDADRNEAADHFTAAIGTGVLLTEQEFHFEYKIVVIVR